MRQTSHRQLSGGHVIAPEPDRSAGRLLLLSGASGAGKTTLGLAVAEKRPRTEFLRRYTTRPRRGAADDKEYIFVTPEDFEKKVVDGFFIEHRHFEFGMSYGLSIASVAETLASGIDVIAITNIGAESLLAEQVPQAIKVLIQVPEDELLRRLESRGSHTQEQIEERIRNSRTVDDGGHLYDHIILNTGSVDAAVDAIVAILDEGRNDVRDR